MAVLVKFAFNWPLLVRKGAVDGVVEYLYSLVVGRVDLNLSVFWPRLGLSQIFFGIGYSSCVFVVGSLVSLVSHTGCFQPGAGVFLALEQEGLSVMRLMFPACRVDSIAVLIQP